MGNLWHRCGAVVVSALLLLAGGCGGGDVGRTAPLVRTVLPPLAPSVPLPVPPPVGPASSVPWWVHGVLHIGTTRIRLARPYIVSAGGTTVVVSRGDRFPTSVVRGHRLVALPRLRRSYGIGGVVISRDGGRLAWVERLYPGPQECPPRVRSRVVAYDLATRRVIGVLRRSARNDCRAGTLLPDVQQIDTDGRIVLSLDGGPTIWTPGHPPVRIRGVPVSSVVNSHGWPGGIQYVVPVLHHNVYGYATISARGVLHRRGRVGPDVYWSPDGSRLAYEDDGRVRLGPPVGPDQPVLPLTGGGWHAIGWESTTDLILAQTGHPGFTRCDVDTRTCEQVADGPTTSAVVPDDR